MLPPMAAAPTNIRPDLSRAGQENSSPASLSRALIIKSRIPPPRSGRQKVLTYRCKQMIKRKKQPNQVQTMLTRQEHYHAGNQKPPHSLTPTLPNGRSFFARQKMVATNPNQAKRQSPPTSPLLTTHAKSTQGPITGSENQYTVAIAPLPKHGACCILRPARHRSTLATKGLPPPQAPCSRLPSSVPSQLSQHQSHHSKKESPNNQLHNTP